MTDTVRHQILLVDDEPRILEGLTLHLRRKYDVITAPSGAVALGLLHNRAGPAVVVSDMHMPGMDGATFLSAVRQHYPDTVRILLTGQANVQGAIAAINEGQVFRFLTKPCAPGTMLVTLESAVAQHELLTSERVLLQETLHGSIEALVEVLALANPVSFGFANRLKRLVGELARALGETNCWQIEVAAMLSQLGAVTLPPEVAEKVYVGANLSADEMAMVARLPAVTEHLLAHIPRLEIVRGILARHMRHDRAPLTVRPTPQDQVGFGAALLNVAAAFDQLTTQGESAEAALGLLQSRKGLYDPAMLAALTTLRGGDDALQLLRELPLAALTAGMVLATDARLVTGTLLAPRGYVITDSFVARCANMGAGSVVEPLCVTVPRGPA
jgi:response regulator RpfG family c-di-GMP phosphodiesterase